MPIKAILIAGPTASGKSGAGLELAARFGGTIINADSMQVYRELRLLTARPSEADEARVPHRLYGTVPAAEAYSVGRWLGDAGSAIAEAHEEGRLPILVGGTGLYFKALTEGLAPVPDIPAEIGPIGASDLSNLAATPFMPSLPRVTRPWRRASVPPIRNASCVRSK